MPRYIEGGAYHLHLEVGTCTRLICPSANRRRRPALVHKGNYMYAWMLVIDVLSAGLRCHWWGRWSVEGTFYGMSWELVCYVSTRLMIAIGEAGAGLILTNSVDRKMRHTARIWGKRLKPLRVHGVNWFRPCCPAWPPRGASYGKFWKHSSICLAVVNRVTL